MLIRTEIKVQLKNTQAKVAFVVTILKIFIGLFSNSNMELILS